MYYSVDFYPRLGEKLAESISAIRRAYDPTWPIIKPHINIIFPATNTLDEQLLCNHIEAVLSSWSPFIIELNGSYKLHNHWLFLLLKKGDDKIKRLNRQLYTGYLAQYRKKPGQPGFSVPPHIGLGLFLKAGCVWDWRNPRESDFDKERYEEALYLAQALPLPVSIPVEKLHLTAIPEVVTEWTTGKRATYPGDAKMITIREFPLARK